MVKIIILAALCFAAFKYVGELKAQSNDPANTPVRQTTIESRTDYSPGRKSIRKPAPTVMNFRCDGRQYCGQMTSRAEAEYFLQHCPHTRMDGDDDGIPCENDNRFK
ncbi:excalibur calcium-binding domain-containing protein [Paraglaciecola polaris]|uniref:Excalibur calcium-binding domain-containing protein n=1 Tax=Paraglaciecola polaris LMG 21857 TaxID=1129793 RepID=K6YGX4_9ALTE|nr:excalibur calcium-binding domain-containing protein [Paraglaciecola polaris]GAC31984.1 hypothetical protein GPLA_1069 [Paraglaciecola polaris LMG 21857]|tara:strand:+ start:724 stop:1044 length:321 start_codon:yes stop_codon:yes gene_type:complete